MKKNSLLNCYIIAIFFCAILLLQVNCKKSETAPPNTVAPADKSVVLNFSFSNVEEKKRSSNEVPLSQFNSDLNNINKSAERRGGCGGSFSGSFGGTGFHVYPNDTIDLSSTVEGSTITLSVSAFDVPNRFTVYSSSGTLLASSPWMGFANYSGPWGTSLNTNPNGTLTFTRSSSAIYLLRVETSTKTTSDSYQVTVGCATPSFITKTFVGVSVKYYASTGLLQFGNGTDYSLVLDSLDAQYERYNTNYDNLYPTLTPDQMDSVDDVNHFDEFVPFRQFESLFPGYASKRSQVETIENTWLTNNFTGTDPDDIDQTYDDAENTVSNSSYKVIIGTTTYSYDSTASVSGMNALAAGNQTAFAASSSDLCLTITNPCITNRRRHKYVETADHSRVFKVKVAINSWAVRSGAKGKVVSFKKGSRRKRSRVHLAVLLGGTIHDCRCGTLFTFSNRNPSPTGYKKRKSLKVSRHQPGIVWSTQWGELATSFDAQNIWQSGVTLNR